MASSRTRAGSPGRTSPPECRDCRQRARSRRGSSIAGSTRPRDLPGSETMCLLVLAWRSRPRYRLVVAANRDEFHARPAAPLAPWNDDSGIVGGRDPQANGTWLALDARGRFGSVTNFREFGRRRRSAPSRGGLIPDFL